jgi:hypothetical protein
VDGAAWATLWLGGAVLQLLGFAVLGSAPWRRPAGEPDQSPAVLDALGAR